MIDPGLGVVLARKSKEVATQGIAEELRAIHAELFGPALRLGRFPFVDPEAEHCHTPILVCMTSLGAGDQPLVGTPPLDRGVLGAMPPLGEPRLRAPIVQPRSSG